MNDGTDDYYYVHDHLYSPAALLDDDGSVIERYEYDVYGYPHIMNASYESRETSDYSNPYMFAGRELDTLDENGLRIMYYRNRYYDPGTGRFLTCDPLGYWDGMNLYNYVRGMPTYYVDPFGFIGFHCAKMDKCRPGDIDYEILDRIITPYHVAPTYKEVITSAKAASLGLEITTVAEVATGIYMGISAPVIVAKVGKTLIDEAMVYTIKKTFRKVIKELEEGAVESYLKVQLKKCKKEWCGLRHWLSYRYNWKDDKVKYYQCKDGSYGGTGAYFDPADAADHIDACEDTFGEKFGEAKSSSGDLSELFWPYYEWE